jgi:hypothetical protein
MAERTLLTERIQLGVEATPGVAATVNRRLLSANIDFGPGGEVQTFRPSGSKYPSISTIGREWAEGSLDGKPTYDEMLYWLALCFGAPTTTTPGGGTNSRQHVFKITSIDLQDPKTATLERGSSVRAHKSLYTFLSGIGLEYNRSEINLTGDVMAQAITDGITLTPSGITELPLIPILPQNTSVYFDALRANLGVTKLLRALSVDWSFGNRFGAVWPLNSALASFAATYETEPDAEVNISLEADSSGMNPLTALRAGGIGFMRIETVGPVIEAAITYKLTCDFALRHRDMPSFGDEDDLMTMEWKYGMFHDGTWGTTGQVGEITLINTTATL